VVAGDSAETRASLVTHVHEGQQDMDIGHIGHLGHVVGYHFCVLLSFLHIIYFYKQFTLLIIHVA